MQIRLPPNFRNSQLAGMSSKYCRSTCAVMSHASPNESTRHKRVVSILLLDEGTSRGGPPQQQMLQQQHPILSSGKKVRQAISGTINGRLSILGVKQHLQNADFTWASNLHASPPSPHSPRAIQMRSSLRHYHLLLWLRRSANFTTRTSPGEIKISVQRPDTFKFSGGLRAVRSASLCRRPHPALAVEDTTTCCCHSSQ